MGLQVGYGFELVICVFGIDRTATTSKIIFDVVAVRSMLFAIHAIVNGPSSSLAVASKKRGTSGPARAPMRQRCAARQLAVRRSGGALAALLDSNRMGAHTAMCAG